MSFVGEYKIHRISPSLLVNGGIEYYLSEGYCTEGKARHNPQNIYNPDRRVVNGINYSRGYGIFISIGLKKPLFSNFCWHALSILRYGTAKSYEQSTKQEDVVWERPVNFSFTGLYIEAGIDYNFIFKKGGQK